MLFFFVYIFFFVSAARREFAQSQLKGQSQVQTAKSKHIEKQFLIKNTV
jgi:hypothetical protein